MQTKGWILWLSVANAYIDKGHDQRLKDECLDSPVKKWYW